MRFFLGAYTLDADGEAAGIGVLRAGDVDGPLAGGQLSTARDAVRIGASPSWLTWHPTLDVVYAALESGGAVQAFRRTGAESFARLGRAVPVGDLVCHVAVEPGGTWLIATCWGDGRVVRIPLGPDGAPSSGVAAAAAVDDHADSGMEFGDLLAGFRLAAFDGRDPDEPAPAVPVADPALPSRAHQARFVGTRTVVTTDMGLDQVRIWHPTGDGLAESERIVLPRGSGPRHTVWHPSGHLFVVTELSHEVFVLAPPAGDGHGWRVVGGAPVSPAARAGIDFAAEIALSRDAEFVYVGLRGSNTIATLRVRGTGAELAPVAQVEAGVDWPRHHVIARDTLLVAGQRSDEVASLGLDERTGVPGRVRHRVATPSPSMLLADRG